MSTMGAKVRRALSLEADIWRSLGQWVSRRQDVSAGAQAFGYAKETQVAVWAFIVLSAVETVVLHLIIPWDVVRWTVLVLSVWGFGWMVGFMASLHVHPHLVGPSTLRIRYWSATDVEIPLDVIDSATVRARSTPTSKSVQRDGATVSYAVASQTNVELRLRRAIVLTIGAEPVEVSEVRLFADDAAAMVRALRQLTSRTPAS